MSLTSHIDNPKSPVHAFFSKRFPNTKLKPLLTFAADRAVRPIVDPMIGKQIDTVGYRTWTAGLVKVLPNDETRYPWGTVGTAIDYRFRYYFAVTPVDKLAARFGAMSMARVFSVYKKPPAFIELEAVLDELLANRCNQCLPLPITDEKRLCSLCYALALYEQCFRGPVSPAWPLLQLGYRAGLEDVLKLCEPRIVEDLVKQSALFAETQQELFSSDNCVLNPKFAASEHLGGADADIIVNRTLLDFKSTKKGRPERSTLWQLIGYLLADWEDQYKIERVGYYYSRYGARIAWVAEDLLGKLAGRKVDIAQEREAFRGMLVNHADPTLRDLRIRKGPSQGLVIRYVPPARINTIERSIPFRPPEVGKGKWHVAHVDNRGVEPPEHIYDLARTPACGSPTLLDSSARPMKPKIGTPLDDVDRTLCKKCLVFTEAYWDWIAKQQAKQTTLVSEWAFHEPPERKGRWHITREDVYPRNTWRKPREPICSAFPVEMKRGGRKVPVPAMLSRLRGDERFCWHCIKYAEDALKRERSG